MAASLFDNMDIIPAIFRSVKGFLKKIFKACFFLLSPGAAGSYGKGKRAFDFLHRDSPAPGAGLAVKKMV